MTMKRSPTGRKPTEPAIQNIPIKRTKPMTRLECKRKYCCHDCDICKCAKLCAGG